MSSLRFSLFDYQAGLAAARYEPPYALCPYYEVDPALYQQYGTTVQRRGDLGRALDELRKRTGREYFGKTYPLQARTLDYSSRSFPAYRFILPEVMTEDWLSIVDWGKFQRDHVLHQPLCGYIVLKILNGDGTEGPLQLPSGQTILDACVERILEWRGTAYIKEFLLRCGMKEEDPLLDASSRFALPFWRVFFQEAAYVAAIFHDLGYPWQYIERLQGNLEGINVPVLRGNRSASNVVELFGNRLLFYALQGYQVPDAASPSTWDNRIVQLVDEALTKTHGFPGALGFLHLNDCVRRFPSRLEVPLRLLCVEWAATAIMMHDMAKIYWGKSGLSPGTPENPFLRLSFDQDPISSIITLVDVIQDFERPAVAFDKVGAFPDEQVTLKYNKACSGTDLELDSAGNMTLRYRMDNEEMRAIKRTSLDKENREYFDARYGYLDLSGLGILNVRMSAE